MGLAAVTLEARRRGSYERHRPETTTLYAVVRDNVETLYTAVAAGFEGAALPPFVRRELEGYLDCGLVCRGFARLECSSCAEQHLVAFACKGRGICPSCLGRKMCQTELAPSWWTSRKGLLSSEFHQCIRENHVQIHSRKTPFVG